MTKEICTKKEVGLLMLPSQEKNLSTSPISDVFKKCKEPRNILTGIFFLLFLCGFIYQVTTFLKLVYKYPTVVSMDISLTGEYLSPAYTFCSSIKVSREEYCDRYSEHCMPTNDEFCKKHEVYCKTNNETVKEEYNWTVKQDEVLELGLNYSDLEDLNDDEASPPLPRRRYSSSYEYSYCYSVNGYVESQDMPWMIPNLKNENPRFTVNSFSFNPQISDVFEPDVPPGIFFAIHSPYEAVNPFHRGYFLSPGKQYIIDVYIKEDERLKHPYDTNCTDYNELWRMNNRTGPRTKQMCRQKCYVDYYVECYNCSKISYDYPSEAKICSEDDLDVELTGECAERHPYDCQENCQEECLKTTFITELVERPIKRSSSENNPLDLISVDVDIYDDEIMHYKFVPKYEDIEVFSYVGGFIGMWLGISFVQIIQFFKPLFSSIKCFKKTRPDENEGSA